MRVKKQRKRRWALSVADASFMQSCRAATCFLVEIPVPRGACQAGAISHHPDCFQVCSLCLLALRSFAGHLQGGLCTGGGGLLHSESIAQGAGAEGDCEANGCQPVFISLLKRCSSRPHVFSVCLPCRSRRVVCGWHGICNAEADHRGDVSLEVEGFHCLGLEAQIWRRLKISFCSASKTRRLEKNHV